MTDSPSQVSPEQLRELYLDVKVKKNRATRAAKGVIGKEGVSVRRRTDAPWGKSPDAYQGRLR